MCQFPYGFNFRQLYADRKVFAARQKLFLNWYPAMDFDDDAPPELVETNATLEEEEITVKVPITIVTGRHK